MATDQHRELHEILVGEGVSSSDLSHVLASCDREAIIERDAMVWLIPNLYSIDRESDNNLEWQIEHFHGWKSEWGTLVSCLLAAAKREGGR